MRPSRRWTSISAGIVSIGLALAGAVATLPESQIGMNIILYEILVILGVLGITWLVYLKGLPDT